MIPVTQTKVVIKDSTGNTVVRGNCYAAAIASFLELPISEVPNFEIWFQFDNTFYDDLRDRFLNLKGYKWDDAYEFRVFHPDIIESDGDDAYDRETIERLQLELKDKYYFCSGNSPRDIYHITIWQNGKMVHDPHPTKEGLKKIDAFYQILPLNEDELSRVKYMINRKKVDFPNVA